MTWKEYTVIISFYLLNLLFLRRATKEELSYSKLTFSLYLIGFWPMSLLAKQYLGMNHLFEFAFLYGFFWIAYKEKAILKYCALTYSYIAVKYIHKGLDLSELVLPVFITYALFITVKFWRARVNKKLNHQSFSESYFILLCLMVEKDGKYFDESFFFFLYGGAFVLVFLLTFKIIEFSPVETYVTGTASSPEAYEELKESFPQYTEQIEESLALDDFARYKLEKSYSEQDLSVLQQKLAAGPTGIKKGAYGVLVWRLNHLGELKA